MSAVRSMDFAERPRSSVVLDASQALEGAVLRQNLPSWEEPVQPDGRLATTSRGRRQDRAAQWRPRILT